MGIFDGKKEPASPVVPEIVEPRAFADEPVTPPIVVPVKVINYKILNTLIEQKFIYVQSGMAISNTGELVERVTFIMANQSGRNIPSRTIPILFCPITGASLQDIDFSLLTIK